MIYLFGGTLIMVVISFLKSREKTLRAFKIAAEELIRIAPALLLMIMLVTIFLFLIPDKTIAVYLGNQNKWIGFLFAAILGSITIMPGFIAFPLCGILLKKGVSYMALSAFANTLMLVGVVTFPLEKLYFGTKVALIRNALGLGIAITVAIVTGFFYGELCQ